MTLIVLLFWISFFLLPLLLTLLENSAHVVVSVSIEFLINSKQDALFHCMAYNYCCTDLNGLVDHLRDVPWEDIFKFRVQVGIDVYIAHRKYQVKPHSSPWFSAACAAAIVHRNHVFFFFCTNRINLLNLK